MDQNVLINSINNFSQHKVLVVGDIMVDEYMWGSVSRISQEAPVQIIEVEKQEFRLGGCGNVVNNLASLGASINVASVVGEDYAGKFLSTELSRLGIHQDCLCIDKGRPTTKKTRAIAASQQIVRIDVEKRHFISSDLEKRIVAYVQKHLEEFDIILLSDYGKGVLTNHLTASIIELSRKRSVPIIVDPKGTDFSKYAKASMITPNSKEAETVSQIKINNNQSAEAAASILLEEKQFDAVLITRGKQGMTLLKTGAEKALHIPTQAREVFDVSGAGDTVISVLGLGIASGLSYEQASTLANVAGGIVVGKLGTSEVTKEELLSFLDHDRNAHRLSKEKTLREIDSLIENLKKQQKQIVLTFRNFTSITSYEVEFFRKAKEAGDVLVVGLQREFLANGIHTARSYSPQELKDQAKIIAALEDIDYILTDYEVSLPLVVHQIKPEILVLNHSLTGENRSDLIASLQASCGKILNFS